MKLVSESYQEFVNELKTSQSMPTLQISKKEWDQLQRTGRTLISRLGTGFKHKPDPKVYKIYPKGRYEIIVKNPYDKTNSVFMASVNHDVGGIYLELNKINEHYTTSVEYIHFMNESKNKRKAKRKKSSIVSKSDVNKVFKDAGIGFVKMSTGSYSRPKTHPSKLKGVRGGSVGPMTATSAWRDHNREAERDLYNKLLNAFSRNDEVKFTVPSRDGFDMFIENVAKGKKTVYRFRWSMFPSNVPSLNLDPSYQTYWLTYTVDEETMR